MLGLKRAIDWAAERALGAARAHGRDHRSDGPDGAREKASPPAGARREPALPSMIWIRYENEDGRISERTVTLREAWREGGRLHLTAWCHMEREPRVFAADRIRELVCLATGESAADPAAWLEQHALFVSEKDDATGRALAQVRDELALLAYLGRADGSFDPEEIEVAVDHVAAASRGPVDRLRCAAIVGRIAPDPEDLPAVLERVAGDARRWERLRGTARRLVRADGVLSPGEEGAWDEIKGHYATASAARQAQYMALIASSGLAGVFLVDPKAGL